MKKQEQYRNMMDEIHVSGDVLRKVRDMRMDGRTMKMKAIFKTISAVAAAFAVFFAASNGICYAATGQTWMSKAIVYINGEPTEQDIIWYEDGNGNGTAEISVDEEMESASVITGYEMDENAASVNPNLVDNVQAEIIEEDGRKYLKYNGGKMDITEDLEDGNAEGNFVADDMTYHYLISADGDDYEISLSYYGGNED